VILGTLGYLSPEQASGKPADYRADQFALGALMYEMATRERPFRRETMLESLTATIREEPAPVRSKRADMPAPLEWIIDRCLQKDPGDRYASTSDLARDLTSMRDRLSDLTRGPAIDAPARTRVMPRGLTGWTIAAAVLAAIGLGGYVLGKQAAPVSDSVPSYRALTFQRGAITGARFGSDGKTVYYSMAIGDGPSRVYVTRLDRADSKLLDHIPPAFVLGVSAGEELLVLLTKDRAGYISPGVLASVPAIGGVPRRLAENVTYADWSSDGEHMAVVASTGCEFPRGTRMPEGCTTPRVSPDGRRIAQLQSGRLVTQTAEGVQAVVTDMPHVFGLAWSPDGRELWFTGSETGSAHDRALYATTLDGRRRLVARVPGSLSIYDVRPETGSALVVTGAGWFGINAGSEGSPAERSLDYLGRTEIVGLSADGKQLLLNELRDVGPGTYLRSTDAGETVRLGPDNARGLSPDGKWALVQAREGGALALVPTGAGTAQPLPTPGLEVPPVEYFARWSRDNLRLFVPFRPAGGGKGTRRVHMRERDGSWKAVGPAGSRPFAVSPSGATIAMADEKGVVTLYPVDGGAPTPLADERGIPIYWSDDGSEIFLMASDLLPARVYRRSIKTGRIQPWRSLAPADLTGVMFVQRVLIARDGRSYVYQYSRGVNELYLATNLR
jgi:hypothetical protein